ncbi:hypothetical protein [Streptacidiphilus jiangxiensis]|uniref:hypothetical protein n=1 Tax=Streptacidiphilus jiangxiensis TaxID=235985 RepID=UPI0005AA13FE|nr:hypothetical protein [Streptacidiphilus jiangxiensis]
MATTTLLTAALALPAAVAYADPAQAPAGATPAPWCAGRASDGTSVFFADLQASSGMLTFGHESLTVSGKMLVKQSDGTLAPYSGPYTPTVGVGDAVVVSSGGKVAPDGSFTVHSAQVPFSAGTRQLQLKAVINRMVFCGPSTQVAPVAEPTRIVLDSASAAHVPAWGTATVSGILEYQEQDGTWHPAPEQTIALDETAGGLQGGVSGGDGRFSFTQNVGNAPAHWTVDARDHTGGWDEYLTGSSAGFDVTSIDQQLALHLAGAAVDAHSRLSVSVTVDSSDPAGSQGFLYLQQSGDGKTGWTTVDRIPASPLPRNLKVTLPVNNPHGYWRLYSPAAGGFPEARSNTVHTTVSATKMTGGTPNHTTVRRNGRIVFRGHVYQQGTVGSWKPIAHGYVTLLFRPQGSKTWQTWGRVKTDANGAYTINARAATSGTWLVVWNTPDGAHVDAEGPQTFVRT